MSAVGSPVRICVVGLHNQGRDHVEAALACPEVELVALCDVDDAELAAARERWSLGDDVRLHATLEAAAEDPGVEALVVALPHHLHADAVRLAAERGKHLLKEKPLGRTLAEAVSLAAPMRRAGLVLHTGVQRRHHATYVRLRELLTERGPAESARLTMTVVPRPAPAGQPADPGWRGDFDMAGGGVLIDLGYHGVDLLNFLFGPMEALACTTWGADGLTATRSVEANTTVWARAGQVWVHARFGRAATKEERLEVEFGDGVFAATRERIEWRPSGAEPEVIFRADRGWEDTLVAQLVTFAAAVRAGREASNDLTEQLPALRFIGRCYALQSDHGVVGQRPAHSDVDAGAAS